MAAFTATDFIWLWETGLGQHPLDLALTVLGRAYPEVSRTDLARHSIGQRDLYLLALYEQSFGPSLEVQANCPACAERLEFSLDTRELRAAPDGRETGPEYKLILEGWELVFRLPDSFDLAAVITYPDIELARLKLLELCLLKAEFEGEAVLAQALPPEIGARLVAEMSECDPQANLMLDLTCPVCQERWQLGFDIGLFIWGKIETQARRLLREVHTLAQAYAWSEADILGMSAARRQFYLNMVS
jgi:hypothetical protein